MLEDLPIEILQQITGQLPTASAIVNLSLTNRKLHETLAVDDYAIFRQFVQNRFPSVITPPYWKDAARILTSRSRAWERRAFVARECKPPRDDHFWPERIEPKQKFGFVSVIDSYETWTTGTERRGVLAIGAAGRLRLRINEEGNTTWRTWRMPGDHLASEDILDVRLLKPHQRREGSDEQVIVRRANKEIELVESGTGVIEIPGARHPSDSFAHKTRFATDPNYLDCMDISDAIDPLLAVCNTKTIQLFPVKSEETTTQASNILQLEQDFGYKHRKRCARFLSKERLAVSIQRLEGRDSSPIDVYEVTSHGLVRETVSATHSVRGAEGSRAGRQCANTIAPLDATASLVGRPGEVFLSGWTDGNVRLHDLRAPLVPTAEYMDGVDDGQILSLLPIGHERFLAGSHHNACLKTFDLRMPGAHAYSYLNATPAEAPKLSKPTRSFHSNDPRQWTKVKGHEHDREINIFLSVHVPLARRLWQPLPRRPDSRLPRYRGSIYSLSAPSPSSPTVFAGIENYVIQLDFTSIDDVTTRRSKSFDFGLGISHEAPEDVLNLSCYERPRPGHESTDPILLRKQVDWPQIEQTGKAKRNGWNYHHASNSRDGKAEAGWDDRWRLASYDRQSASGPGWRAVAQSS